MTTIYVDRQYREVETLTTEQVFYLLQCKPLRMTLEQLEEWRAAVEQRVIDEEAGWQ